MRKRFDFSDGTRRTKNDGQQPLSKRLKLDPTYCKFGCGRTVSPGKTRRGNCFDTCCKQCAFAHGTNNQIAPNHGYVCNQRNGFSAPSISSFADVNKYIVTQYNLNGMGAHIRKELRNIFESSQESIIDLIVNDYLCPKMISRPSWTPVTKLITAQLGSDSDSDSHANNGGTGYMLRSKYGGYPYLSANEEWPKCGNCEEYMPLLLQLNFDELPDLFTNKCVVVDHSIYAHHFLQLFYCTNYDSCEDGFEDFEPSHLQRFVKIVEDEHRSLEYCATVMKEIETKEFEYPSPLLIASWNMKMDGPTVEEMLYHFKDLLLGLFGNQYQKFIEKNSASFDDKLYGYPRFQNGYLFPQCPQCKQDMTQFLYQHNGSLTQCEFGGVNPTGYLFTCEEHPFVVSFGWSSFG